MIEKLPKMRCGLDLVARSLDVVIRSPDLVLWSLDFGAPSPSKPPTADRAGASSRAFLSFLVTWFLSFFVSLLL